MAAVREGTITWHAGPMNQQVEWMTARMFQFGVNVSHALDDFFSLPRIGPPSPPRPKQSEATSQQRTIREDAHGKA